MSMQNLWASKGKNGMKNICKLFLYKWCVFSTYDFFNVKYVQFTF